MLIQSITSRFAALLLIAVYLLVGADFAVPDSEAATSRQSCCAMLGGKG